MDSIKILDQYIDDHVAIYNADTVDAINLFGDDSVDMEIYSPPFSSLYTYSNSDRDLGNCKSDDEFFQHFAFITRGLYRILKPGRIMAVHCMNLPTSKEKDGYIGIRDFRGDLIRAFQEVGFIYHAEVCIWKNPVTAMQRTKALGLLHKQLKKDSCMSRMGIPDYVIFMRKPGENPDRVTHTNETFPVSEWQEYASPIWDELNTPVWWDINQSDTLNARMPQDDESERHICLAEGTLVLTKRGYVPIETIEVGADEVLTNSGEWHKVVAKAKTQDNADVVQTIAQGVPRLITTPEHKIMAKRGYGCHPKENLCRTENEWTMAKDIDGCYVRSVMPPEIESEIDAQEWWIIGRWLADGHVDCRGKQFFVSVGKDKWNEFKLCAEGHIGHVADKKDCNCYQVGLVDMSDAARNVLKKCGKGAANKVLPVECISLNRDLSESLYCGYMSGDGHLMEDGKETACSTSRALLLGMAIVAQKVRGKVPSVYAGRGERESEIGGRKIHCNEEWNMLISPHYSYSAIGEDATWKKVKRVTEVGTADVWSIEVESDHSYMAEGCIVNNCPLQLPVIERCIRMYSNEGDVIFTPFLGIGSEVYQAIKMNRKGIGIELKTAYFDAAVENIKNAEMEMQQTTLFD